MLTINGIHGAELLKIKSLIRKAGRTAETKPTMHVAWNPSGLKISRGDTAVNIPACGAQQSGSVNILAKSAGQLVSWVKTFGSPEDFVVRLSKDGVEFQHGRAVLSCHVAKKNDKGDFDYHDFKASEFVARLSIGTKTLRDFLRAHAAINVGTHARESWKVVSNVLVSAADDSHVTLTAVSNGLTMSCKATVDGTVQGADTLGYGFLIPSRKVLDIIRKSEAPDDSIVTVKTTETGVYELDIDGVSTMFERETGTGFPTMSTLFRFGDKGDSVAVNVDVQALAKNIKALKSDFSTLSLVPGYGAILMSRDSDGVVTRVDTTCEVSGDGVTSTVVYTDVLERFAKFAKLAHADTAVCVQGGAQQPGNVVCKMGDMTLAFAHVTRADTVVPDEWPEATQAKQEAVKPKTEEKPRKAKRGGAVAKREQAKQEANQADVKPEAVKPRKPVEAKPEAKQAEQKQVEQADVKPEAVEPPADTQVIPEVPPKTTDTARVVKVSESVIPAMVIFRELPGMADVKRHDVRKIRDSHGRKVAYVVRDGKAVRILWREWYKHDDASLDATVRAMAESWAKAA